MRTPESESGVWSILVHPSPPGGSLSSTNLLYRENFLWSVWIRLGLSLGKVVSGILTARRCYGWKLSRTYPVEIPPPYFVLTHRSSLATRKPTRLLLATSNILVRIESPYKDGWSSQFYLPKNYDTFFNQRFLNILNLQ